MSMTTDRPGQEYKVIGKSMPRVDGVEKVTGAAKFGADYSMPGMLWGKVVRSIYAHARIKSLDVSAAEKYPGVVCVLTANDINYAPHDPTGRNNNPLARKTVIFFGQPIAVVAATSKEIADEAAQLVKVEYEPLPVLVDPVSAMQEGAYRLRHDGTEDEEQEDEVDRSEMNIHASVGGDQQEASNLPNVTSTANFKEGDVEEGFRQSDVVIERTFRIGIFHQAYMEPHAALAQWSPDGTLTMWITSQGQFAMRDQLTRFFEMPASKVKVIATEIGGGFGGKFGLITTLTAAVARKARRPVKIVISRSEEFLAATPAPYTYVKIKTGCKKDGTLTALQARVVMDTGAYPGAPMSIGTILIGGSYNFPNYELEGYEVLTNKANVGAYRAPGAPETTFAIEACMEDMARQIGMDPLDFRMKNAKDEGDLWPGQETPLPRVGLKACLEAAKNHPAWSDPLQEGEGKGVAAGGWPGGAGGASAVVRANNDGTFTVVTGTVNLTGSTTGLAQIAAEELGVSLDKIEIVTADTSEAPMSPASGGSQITYTMGHAVSLAAIDARQKLLEYAANMLEVAPEDLEVNAGTIQVRGVPASGTEGERKTSIEYSEVASRASGRQGPISGYGAFKPARSSPGYSATVARVKVDKETGAVKVTRLLGIQDVGRAINPMAVEGQIQGGVVQGVGMALTEEIMYDENGRVMNPGFLDYRLLTCPDLPEVETAIVEVPTDLGPYGARMVGEPSIVPPGAAVANAITNAAGVRVTNIPITGERLLNALKEQKQGNNS